MGEVPSTINTPFTVLAPADFMHLVETDKLSNCDYVHQKDTYVPNKKTMPS